MQALYRKYRSQKFCDIVGQDVTTKTLSNAVKHNRVGHAYIFSGPRGTGKTSTARILAKAVNCVNASIEGEPCNQCFVCKDISSGSAIDVIEIDAASHTGVEDIRFIIEKIEFTPVKLSKKVYIIDEVHMLSKSAFNALLKTLEEPPKHIVFILATTEIHKVPITILSRCQRFDFKLGGVDEISMYLKFITDSEDIKIDSTALECIASIGNGSYRDAVTSLDQILSTQAIIKDKVITEDEVRKFLGMPDVKKVELLVELLLNRDIQQSLKIIDSVVANGINIKYFSACVLEHLRLKLVQIIEGDSTTQTPLNKLFLLIKIFSHADREIAISSIPQLPLEMAVLEFIGTESLDKKQIRKINDLDKKNEPGENRLCKTIKRKSNFRENKNKKQLKDVANGKDSKISFQYIIDKWEEIMLKVKPHNGHLFAFLSRSRLDKFINNKLYITVPYGFYKERITDKKSQKILGDILDEIIGASIRFHCSIGKVMPEEASLKKENNKLIDSAMDVFSEDVV